MYIFTGLQQNPQTELKNKDEICKYKPNLTLLHPSPVSDDIKYKTIIQTYHYNSSLKRIIQIIIQIFQNYHSIFSL